MNQWKILLSFMPDGGAGLYREIPEELQKFVDPFLKTIAKGAEEKAAVKRVIKSTGPSSKYSYPVTIKGKRSPMQVYSANGVYRTGSFTSYSSFVEETYNALIEDLKSMGSMNESAEPKNRMNHLPTYDDFRLFENAGPLASTFKKAGFEEMSKADQQGFGGVQDGGLMYTGDDFIVLYGLGDGSKPIVSVMYGDGVDDQIEAHILNQAEQKAFVAKLESFSKEMDRLCALGAGTEKSEGIKSWLRKFGFQVISGSVAESVDSSLKWKDVKMGDKLEIEWEGPSNVIVSNVHGKTITLRRLGKDGKPNMSKDIHYWLEFDVDEKGYELPLINRRVNESEINEASSNEPESSDYINGWCPIEADFIEQDEDGTIKYAMKQFGVRKPTDLVYASDADGDDEPYGKVMKEILTTGKVTKTMKEPGFVKVEMRSFNGYDTLVVYDYGANSAFARKKDVK